MSFQHSGIELFVYGDFLMRFQFDFQVDMFNAFLVRFVSFSSPDASFLLQFMHVLIPCFVLCASPQEQL